MIESKGPSNDDRKVNNIITKEVIQNDNKNLNVNGLSFEESQKILNIFF